MQITERPYYAKKLAGLMGTPDIKVISGVRGCGKTTLLEGYIRYIAETVPDANIIHVSFDLPQYGPLKEYHALHDFVENEYKKGCSNFVFIDEVQMCPRFELAVTSLHASEKYDICITGSNAFWLSSELATLLTGRTFAISVFPFSFAEFRTCFGADDPNACLDRYILTRGMPDACQHNGQYNGQEGKYEYARAAFETLLARDVRAKHRIRKKDVLDQIAGYMADNIARQISAEDITAMLADSGQKTGLKTVARYMEYLCQAFAFYKIRGYDIQGKCCLGSNDKYYLGDHAFRYAKPGTGNMDYGRILENIIAIDLVRRGYEVCTGLLYKKEIGFVAMRRNEKMYIRLSDNISDDKTFMREAASLLDIRDAYPKIILARTRHPRCQYEGIQIIDIADWLCQDNVYPMR